MSTARSRSRSRSRPSSTCSRRWSPTRRSSTGSEDELTVWISTQGIFAVRDELAARFGLPKPAVRVIAEFVGGGFGSKIEAGTEATVAAELSRRARRPVSLIFTRHEEQLVGGHRASTHQTIRLAATREGTLTASELDCVIGMGSAGGMIPMVHVPAMTLYACANAQAMRFPVKLNVRPVNAFRAPGVVEGMTGYEQAIDELALALELDPLELRRRAHATPTRAPGCRTPASRCSRATTAPPRCRAGPTATRSATSASPDGLLRGLGCATQMWFGSAAGG